MTSTFAKERVDDESCQPFDLLLGHERPLRKSRRKSSTMRRTSVIGSDSSATVRCVAATGLAGRGAACDERDERDESAPGRPRSGSW
jgi:hypothetical protein